VSPGINVAGSKNGNLHKLRAKSPLGGLLEMNTNNSNVRACGWDGVRRTVPMYWPNTCTLRTLSSPLELVSLQ